MAALDPFMGVLDFSLKLCSLIYMRAANVSANKERCQHIAQRVKALEGLILTIKNRGPGQLSPVVDSALRDLCGTLTSVKTLMEKFTRTKALMIFLKSSSHEGELLNLDKRLSDTFQVLSGALLIEQGDTLNRVYNTVSGNTGPTTPMPQPNNMLMPIPTSPLPYSSMPPMALCYPEPPMTYSPMSPMNYSPMPPMATCNPTSSVIYSTMTPMSSVPFSTTFVSNPATSTMEPMLFFNIK